MWSLLCQQLSHLMKWPYVAGKTMCSAIVQCRMQGPTAEAHRAAAGSTAWLPSNWTTCAHGRKHAACSLASGLSTEVTL